MKIRELHIQGLRNFPAEGRRISFVDPYTDEARAMNVIVGSNGSGKSTVLSAIASMLRRLGRDTDFGLTDPEPLPDGARLRATFDWPEPPPRDGIPSPLRLVWGGGDQRSVSHPSSEVDLAAMPAAVAERDGRLWGSSFPEADVRWAVLDMESGQPSFMGGAIVLPTARHFRSSFQSTIRESEHPRDFVAIANGAPEEGLMPFWIWQNYLDLEAQAEGRPNLIRFVGAIEDLLGHDQTVRIKRGRITIERPHLGDVIEPHQLPSGEQQILTLFGELLRHLRPHASILIDEPEISLHPALQRAVVHKLRALARKHDLQIILATHSMEIVKAVAPHEVISLDDILLAEGIDEPAEHVG